MKLLKSALFLTCFSLSSIGFTQNAFWSFDTNDNELSIPLQCDGQFDETRGGVFLPTPDELFDYGETFLLEKGKEKNNAAYCLLSAALQGHVEAQYRLAQLYNKGIIFPQNDLAAYKWSFLASLYGHKKAEQMALTLEQLLSTQDIDLATTSIKDMLPKITSIKNADLSKINQDLDTKKEELAKINKEIDDILGINFVSPTGGKNASVTRKQLNHFSSEDRL
ncbi:MAG: sel1 repeat family protein [Alphaproteobacteria bacterium]|nr:sel1 repeat family protein [Alphaproteobacteria bacterium]